ncbi:hypothetical protein M0R72_18960 [Candidatus Pacearchaeota archaeon]|jgi:hypothetical protein|nr:hypothetical protein [Candidatus Pacearchaeota archaeon]
MTPPIFNLGDEVEVIGTDRYGNDTGKKTLTICMMWSDDGKTFYSDRYSPWYPANSLRLVNEKPLSPMQVTCTYDPVDCECRAIQVSCPCGRKAEIALPEKSEWKEVSDELKIGDYVAIVGPNRFGNSGALGHIFQITQVYHSDQPVVVWYSSEGENCYPAKSLRKLTPEEIADHMQPKDETIIRMASTIERCCERLSAIEKRLSAIETLQFSQQDAIVHFENRLTFVEKFQRDQDDFVGRAIRDGVAEISDFRRKA